MDKTATFVARNGPDFEKRILQNEASNEKFSFLQPDNKFNAYYRMKATRAPAPHRRVC